MYSVQYGTRWNCIRYMQTVSVSYHYENCFRIVVSTAGINNNITRQHSKSTDLRQLGLQHANYYRQVATPCDYRYTLAYRVLISCFAIILSMRKTLNSDADYS